MKTEMEKCLAGEWYDCHDPFFMNLKSKAHHLLMKYNSLPYEQKTEKHAVLKEMFGSIGANVSVGHSFICDYGCNIHIGDNVTVNTGCTFVDCNKITIGNNVLVAPNVQIYTATHPVEFNERLILTETLDGCKYVRRTFALPVMIEDGCWIGGGVIILPSVTIGQKSVIGAGSVVTKDIPANSLAVDTRFLIGIYPKADRCRVVFSMSFTCHVYTSPCFLSSNPASLLSVMTNGIGEEYPKCLAISCGSAPILTSIFL